MKKKNLLAALSMLGFLSGVNSSVMASENPQILSAAQNAMTRSDHEAVAKALEEEAKEMQAKAQEQKELLEHYEDKSYLYGRQAQDMKSHTEALVRDYEQLVEEDIKEAAVHRKIAAKLEDNNHAASSPQKRVAVRAAGSASGSK